MVVDADATPQTPLVITGPELTSPPIISHDWNVLGPFQIGTREAVWGADPLELFGGFRQLEYDPDAKFRSSLAPQGIARWSSRHFKPETFDDGNARVSLHVDFPDVDWSLLRLAYGWSASQYQAWARGYITVDAAETRSFQIYTDGILEFWLNDERFFGGDFYSYRRAPPVIHLQPGRHRLDIRLVRDVRAMGGVGEPVIQVQIELQALTHSLVVDQEHVIAPDIVDGRLASKLASVPVRNAGLSDIFVTRAKSATTSWDVSLNSALPLQIAPGQTRALSLKLAASSGFGATISVEIEYEILNEERPSRAMLHHTLRQRLKRQPHKITFLRPGDTVSFALIRPPQHLPQAHPTIEQVPVFVYLHGAGVDADGDQNSETLDEISDLPMWTILASGVTSWSGDDWHQWGWPDVEAAVAAIPEWMKNYAWEGPGADLDRWLVAGHSNGGQGVWYALTHKPDKIFAAAPVSGYASIQKYVPYNFWHETDPRRMSIIHASMNSYRHELLISNADGISIMHQHGEKDDNVPCFHSRRMNQLGGESGLRSAYNELLDKGHWFDGVMTTEALRRFYFRNAELSRPNMNSLFNFSLVVANPADTGAKSGVLVLQLIDPGQLGRVEVCSHEKSLTFTTSNVQSLSIDLSSHQHKTFTIDRQDIPIPSTDERKWAILLRKSQDLWERADTALRTVDAADNQVGLADSSLRSRMGEERSGNQLGSLDAILRSKGSFLIKNHDAATRKLAIQISRNLFQYFAADARIVDTTANDTTESTTGNLITVGVGASMPRGISSSHPIRLSESSLHIRDSLGHEKEFKEGQHGLAAIFLRPLPEERLEVVIWGTDRSSAAVASQLFPLMPGAGQPDFIVLTRECLWKGADGTLAMGFFDSFWNVTRSSFVL